MSALKTPVSAAPSASSGAPRGDYRVKLLSAVNSMPPLPNVLNQLLGMLNSERASAGQIASMIERDSVLSGSVLRSVNSAYYAIPGRVSSIRQAVTLLGFQTVRNLALAFSMRRMMSRNQPAAAHYNAYSRHALATAIMTQLLAIYKRSEDVEAAFAAGLFHDVGKLLILTTAPDLQPKIIKRWESSAELSYLDAERETLDITHPELSAIVLESWKLPTALRDAARHHHQPEAFAGPGADEQKSLAHLVRAADLAVNQQRISTTQSEVRKHDSPDEAMRALGLEDQQEQLFEKFKSEFSNLESLFG